MASRTAVHTYDDHGAAVTRVKVCGDMVVSASQDGVVRLSSFASYQPPPQSATSAASGSGASTAPADATATGAEKFDDSDSDGEGGSGSDADADTRGADSDADTPARSRSGAASSATAGPTSTTAAGSGAAAGSSSGGIASNLSGRFASALSAVPFTLPMPPMASPVKGRLGRKSSKGSSSLRRHMCALKLTGHSGPVSAVDAYERPSAERAAELQRQAAAAAAPPAAADAKVTGGGLFGFGRKKAAAPATATREAELVVEAPAAAAALPSTTNYVVVTGGTDGTVKAWATKWTVDKKGYSTATALLLSSHSNMHKSGSIIEQVKLSADGCKAVSVGRDGSMGIVDIPTGKTWVMTMPTQSKGLFSWGSKDAAPLDPVTTPSGLPLVTCSIDSARGAMIITTAGADGTARCWDLRAGAVSVAFPSGTPIWAFSTVPAHGGGSMQLAADGSVLAPAAPLGDRYLVSGHEDGVVRVWDSRKPSTPMTMWAGNGSPVTALRARGDKVVTGCADGVVRLWDARSGQHLRCDGHTGQVVDLGVADDYLVSASWDGTLRCWYPSS